MAWLKGIMDYSKPVSYRNFCFYPSATGNVVFVGPKLSKNTYVTLSRIAEVLALTALVIFTTSPSAWAQAEEKKQSAQVDSSDTNAQTWPQSTKYDFTIEPELFLGKRGYIHGGFEFEKPINDKYVLGLGAHVVRENSEGRFFPSVGVTLTTENTAGFEFTAFTFGYIPVDDSTV